MQILSQAYVSLLLSLLLRHQNEESSFLFQSIQYIFFLEKATLSTMQKTQQSSLIRTNLLCFVRVTYLY